jgi:hypothetical protein
MKLLILVIITLILCQGDISDFNKFEKCMEINQFDYTDSECEYCWKQIK